MSAFFVLTLSDVLELALGFFVICAAGVVGMSVWLRQSRCKHDGGVNETQACDAICKKCGKNLGFIGKLK